MNPELTLSNERVVTLRRAHPGAIARICSFPVLLAIGVAASVFLFDSRTIADPDIWWHLRNAEVLVQTHSVVNHDFYSFTATGSRWINEAWLSEVPFYLGWRWMGPRGIYLVMLAETELILVGVFCLASLTSRNVKAAFVASSLAVWMATVSFGPRTLLSGWICLLAELFLLEQFKRGRDVLWSLVPLFVVWANLHGSWLIGMVFFGIFCLCGIPHGKWGRIEAIGWTPAQIRKLIVVGTLSVAGLFLNPYGYRLVFYPFNFAFQQKLNVGHVDEWASLDFHSARGKIVFALLAVTLVLALVRKRRWRLEEVAFLLIAFYAALTYSRFLFLAAIVLTPILAKELDFLPQYRPEIDKTWLNAILIAGILGACAGQFPSNEVLMGETVQTYPVKAGAYLQHFRPSGPVFNDFQWGGYLIWEQRHIPVFIDSRIDIYEYNGVFPDFLRAIRGRDSLEVLKKYGIRYVLYRRDSALAYLMMHTPGWVIDYQDETTVLLERIEPGGAANTTRGP